MNEEKTILNVSVGVPIYNEEKNITDLLYSLKSQDGIELDRIILFDDGSKDETVKVIRAIINDDEWMRGKIDFISARVNAGKSAGLRQIFQRNASSLLVILDSDIVLEDKNAILQLVTPFRGNKNLGMTSGWYYFVKTRKPLQDVFEFSAELLKRIGKVKPLYACSGGFMCLSRENMAKINIPVGLTRTDAFLYMATVQNKFSYVFCPEARFLIKMDFNKISLGWYLRAQKRVGSYPQYFQDNFSKESFDEATMVPFSIKALSFIETFLNHPVKGTIYFLFKAVAVINTKAFTGKKTDYLWREGVGVKK